MIVGIDDTIAAIATPLGESAIGIVRLTGKDAFKVVDKIFRGKTKLMDAPTHTIHYGKIVDPATDKVVDEVLVMVMRAPHTYTREDMVEINAHGGQAPLRKILELLLKHGARLAQPGEFTQRAVLHGRIDLTQAQAVLEIVRAKTEEALYEAVAQLEGKLSTRMDELKDKLVDILTQLEFVIDFPDDADDTLVAGMYERLCNIRDSIATLLEAAQRGKLLREGMELAIIGRPNVGKSSVFNALLEEERAIVTPYPGTTRDLLEGWIDVKGVPVKLVDTAGIRETSDPVEQIGVERARRAVMRAWGIIYVFDQSEGILDEDIDTIKRLPNKLIIGVLNKNDLPSKVDGKALKGFNFPIVSVSALKHRNISELVSTIANSLDMQPSTYVMLHEYQVEALREAHAALTRICEGWHELTLDLVAYEVRCAINALGKITGEVTSEDIFDRIFASFCVGK